MVARYDGIQNTLDIGFDIFCIDHKFLTQRRHVKLRLLFFPCLSKVQYITILIILSEFPSTHSLVREGPASAFPGI